MTADDLRFAERACWWIACVGAVGSVAAADVAVMAAAFVAAGFGVVCGERARLEEEVGPWE